MLFFLVLPKNLRVLKGKVKFWIAGKGNVIVNKLKGATTLDELIKTQEEVYSILDEKVNGLVYLSDISEATFEKLGYEELGSILQPFTKYIEKTQGMKVAIYNGLNSKEDFLKASTFSKQELNNPIEIKNFFSLESAMDWLGLSEIEKNEIKKLLVI